MSEPPVAGTPAVPVAQEAVMRGLEPGNFQPLWATEQEPI